MANLEFWKFQQNIQEENKKEKNYRLVLVADLIEILQFFFLLKRQVGGSLLAMMCQLIDLGLKFVQKINRLF